MIIKSRSIFLILIVAIASCSTIKIRPYLYLQENQIDRFQTFFIRSQQDSNYKAIEKIYGRISDKDTVIALEEIIYKTLNIEGQKVFYAIATSDTLKAQAPIGPKYFLSSAIIFENDLIRTAPAYDLEELRKLKLADFKFEIPGVVKRNDSIRIVDDIEKLILCDFHKENIVINNKKLRTIKIRVIQDWPTTTYYGDVWLSKKYGLVKWIRSTGLIQTKEF